MKRKMYVYVSVIAMMLLASRTAYADPARERSTDSSSPRTEKITIPLVDLSEETDRQVIVDREKGQYLGHPDTVALEDGTIFVVYPKGHAKGPLVLKKSLDGGLTWSERLQIPENWATSISCPTIHSLTGPDGRKRLIVLTGNERTADIPVRMAVSEDDGTSWTPLRPIGEPGYTSIVTGSSMLRLKDGRYMALQHFHNGGFPQLYKMLSADGGLSWSTPVQITDSSPAKLCEPGAIRSPDGNQIAVMIRDNRWEHNMSWAICSDDEGETWSNPFLLSPALTGHRHVARYAPDGRLVVTFRDMAYQSPTRGDWVVWVGTYDDVVNKKDGQYRVRLMDNRGGLDSTYPGLELMEDGTFVTTTYGHWEKGEKPYIVSIRFTIEQLDAAVARESGRKKE